MISLPQVERQGCGSAETQRCLILQERQVEWRTPPWAYFPIQAVLNAAAAATSNGICVWNPHELNSTTLSNHPGPNRCRRCQQTSSNSSAPSHALAAQRKDPHLGREAIIQLVSLRPRLHCARTVVIVKPIIRGSQLKCSRTQQRHVGRADGKGM